MFELQVGFMITLFALQVGLDIMNINSGYLTYLCLD